MPSVVVDSGPLFALVDQSDAAHLRAAQFLSTPGQTLVANLPVLTEVVYLLNYSGMAHCAFLSWASEAITIDQQTTSDLGRMVEIMAKYADLPADFADASLLALCERRGIERIATFDKDFAICRLANHKALANVIAKT